VSGELDNWLPERAPNPTLAFGPYGGVYCLNCNDSVANCYARSHALTEDGMPGCGITFEFVSSAGNPPRAEVEETRPDLPWREVEWAK
jgi:hypothetical protein